MAEDTKPSLIQHTQNLAANGITPVAAAAAEETQGAKPAEETPGAVKPAETTPAPATAPAAAEFDLSKLSEEQLELAAKAWAKKNPAPKQLSKEEKEAQEAKEKDDSLVWAIAAGKIKKEDYDKAITAKAKDKRAIALDVFAAEAREENPKLSDAEIEEQFKDHYREELDDDSPARKAALRAMNKTADAYLSQFKNVDTLVDDYRAYNKGHETYKGYARQVGEVVKELPKEMTLTIPYKEYGTDKEVDTEFKVAIDDKILEAVKKEIASESNYYLMGADEKEVKAEDIREKIMERLYAKTYHHAVKEVARQAVAKADYDRELKLKNAGVNLKQPFTAAPPTEQKKLITHKLNLAANGIKPVAQA